MINIETFKNDSIMFKNGWNVGVVTLLNELYERKLITFDQHSELFEEFTQTIDLD